MSNSAANHIRDDVRRRGIMRLCHFTQSRKFAHILGTTRALIPTQELRERYPDLLDVTDTERLDGHLGHVCCSIQYPNGWYFEKIRDKDPLFRDWVILALNPSLLWERETLFSPRNAAAQRGHLLKGGWEGWTDVFQRSVSGAQGRTRHRTPQMLASCPTDDQAETLIPGPIPQSYITAVIVPNRDKLLLEQARLHALNLEMRVEWCIAPALFSTSYSGMIRQGRLPPEEIIPPQQG
jgi:ssDNA thymidine ADP-ribosyltransferase DarT-like protein